MEARSPDSGPHIIESDAYQRLILTDLLPVGDQNPTPSFLEEITIAHRVDANYKGIW